MKKCEDCTIGHVANKGRIKDFIEESVKVVWEYEKFKHDKRVIFYNFCPYCGHETKE